MSYRVAVCLSGCGNVDGGEIHESVLSLLFLSCAGVQVQIFAPDKEQTEVFDYYHQKKVKESRSVLLESARIARGDIRPLNEFVVDTVDAVLFPGGLGVIKNLSNYDSKKSLDFVVDAEVERVILTSYDLKKPLAFICIAPLLAARVLGFVARELRLTIGKDESFSRFIHELGAFHQVCSFDDCVVDFDNKVVSTPAYMTAQNIYQVSLGIEKLVQSLLKMIEGVNI